MNKTKLFSVIFFLSLTSNASFASSSVENLATVIQSNSAGQATVSEMITVYKKRLNQMNTRIHQGENAKIVLNQSLQYVEREIQNQTRDSYLGSIALKTISPFQNKAKQLVAAGQYVEAQRFINETFGLVINLF